MGSEGQGTTIQGGQLRRAIQGGQLRGGIRESAANRKRYVPLSDAPMPFSKSKKSGPKYSKKSRPGK